MSERFRNADAVGARPLESVWTARAGSIGETFAVGRPDRYANPSRH
jgi:hypothetical protein